MTIRAASVGSDPSHGLLTASRAASKADRTTNQGKRNVKSDIVRAHLIEPRRLHGVRVICTDQYIADSAPAANQAFMRIPATPPTRGEAIRHHLYFRKICLCFRSFAAGIRIS
jgi:hypothetical protein